MWNFENWTNQLGDAFEKVKKEVEAFGDFDDEANSSLTEAEGADDSIGTEFTPVLSTENRKKPLTETKLEDRQPSKKIPTNAENRSHGISGEPSDGSAVLIDQIKLRILPVQDISDEIEQLRRTLSVREQQLHSQSLKLLQLQERNEYLEQSALSVSKEEIDELRVHYEERLRTAEQKIYSLTRENDALLRGSASQSDRDTIIKEKDDTIAEVMAEGQRLSKKQLDLENAIRKKSSRIKELESENESFKSKLMSEMAKCEKLSSERLQLNQTLQENESRQQQQLEKQRLHFEALLKEASNAKSQAEQAEKDAAREGLYSRIQELEEKNQQLSAEVESLHSDLENQRTESEFRVSNMRKEMQELENRCHETEMKHEELLARFPEATKPLLSQLEALRADMESKTEAWAMAERSLLDQLESAGDLAQTQQLQLDTAQLRIEELMKKNQRLEDKCNLYEEKLHGMEKSTEGLRTENDELLSTLKEANERYRQLETETENMKSLQQQALEKLQSDLSNEKTAKLSAEMQLRQLQLELAKQKADLDDLLNKAASGDAKQKRPNSKVEDELVNSEVVERESSRSFVTTKQHQIERLQKQIQALESTRDHLSVELVTVTQRAQKAEQSLRDFETMKEELSNLNRRYASAIELLGEREEQIEEVKADLEDFKQMYREQVAYVAEQLSGSKS